MNSALTLSLHNVQLRVGGQANGRVLLKGLDLTVQAGERWVVLGSNGVGKTSLLLVLAGLVAPDSGVVSLGSQALQTWSPQALAKQRAWCPQFWYDPFPLCAWEAVAAAIEAVNLEMSAPQIETQARFWLGKFEAGHLAQTDIRTLSGGERQRVALATACAQEAPLLLLDEPTAHLDWAHQNLLRNILHDWTQIGGSVVSVLHDLNMAWALATHVLLLKGEDGLYFGPREVVMQAEILSDAYGVAVQSRDELDGSKWFRVSAS